MPAWGRRENYSAVTLTVCALAVVFVASYHSKVLIEVADSNKLKNYNAEFLNRAQYQKVDWYTTDMDSAGMSPVEGELLSENPFVKSRREDKPIMLYVGGGWSRGAKYFDEAVFGDREIAARLNQDYVSVRIDISVEPEWRGALLPIRRANEDIDPGFSIWFLEPTGEIIDVIWRTSWKRQDIYNEFLETLSFVSFVRKVRWKSLSDSDRAEQLDARTWMNKPTERALQLKGMMDLQEMQREAVKLLKGSSSYRGVPNIDRFVDAMNPSKNVDLAKNFETWNAAKYRVLLRAGNTDVSLYSPSLLTSRTDIIDGGFFWLGSSTSKNSVEFGKLAASQAEMAAVLAHLWQATDDELFYYYSRRALESVHDQFLIAGSWPSFIEVQMGKYGRSARHSFSPSRLRLEFSGKQRELSEDLGLVPSDNQQMVPYIVSADTLSNKRNKLDDFVQKMKLVGDYGALKGGGLDFLDSAGTTVARAIEAARILNDDELLQLALTKAERLDQFRSGLDDVRHKVDSSPGTDVWLGDYTAYADAMMEVYAATGDESKYWEGKGVLERALFLFQTEDDTVFVGTTGDRSVMGVDLFMPSIVDDGQPPALPALVRLAFRYGALTRDADLLQTATRISERYSEVANQYPESFSSFISAAQEVMLSGCLLVAGEDRVKRAREIGIQNPGMFVVPGITGEHEPGQFRVVQSVEERVGD